jgi:hypothetical protein
MPQLCLDFSITGLHGSYSENSIHFFDLPQTAIGTTHSDRSLDSFSGALGQAVSALNALSVEINFYVFFLGANIAILDINRFGTVDGNDTKKMQPAEDAVGASGQIGCDKFYGVSS